jgi:hypothetical protein
MTGARYDPDFPKVMDLLAAREAAASGEETDS